MKIFFWRREPLPFKKHAWDGSYVCIDCRVYWWSTEPEEKYGECPGPSDDEDED